MRRTRWISAGTALVALALAAGCGGAESGSATPAPAPTTAVASASDPLDQVLAAAEATLAAGSARFTMSMDVTGGGGSARILTASGSTDFDAQIAEMEMSLAQQPGAPVQTIRSLMFGTTIYQQPAGANRWFSMDAAALGMGQGNPTDQIRQFRNTAKDVRDAGTAEISGRNMRHYELTLTPSAPTTGAMAPAAVPADLYLDAQGRFARFETQTPGPNQTTAVTTMDFSDYGVPVSVQAPDPGIVDPMPR